MVKAYCDSGGYDRRFKDLGEQVELVNFAHGENLIRATKTVAPSVAEYDSAYLTYDDEHVEYDQCGSEKFEKILVIVGKNNLTDAKHLDAAYKAGCEYFFTRDKGDIIDKRKQLEIELGFKIYNPVEEFGIFLEVLNSK